MNKNESNEWISKNNTKNGTRFCTHLTQFYIFNNGIYIYIYIYICTHTHTHLHIHVYIHTYTDIYIYIYIYMYY